MRAVDHPEAALFTAISRLEHGGLLAILTTEPHIETITAASPLKWSTAVSIPESRQRVLLLGHLAV
jgi:hypothetical protein